MRDDFAILILSHGRPDKIKTLNTFLKKGNYTGKWYIVIDNEDNTASQYYDMYGDHVVQFDKLAISKTFDTADTFDNRKTIVYARNACFPIAKDLGLNYFLQLDDDYVNFEYRKTLDGKVLRSYEVKNCEPIFEAMIDFLEDTGALTVAFAQGGDLIGGINSKNFLDRVSRKAMNTFFCKTDKPFQFVGRINEDVNTYTSFGMRGELILSVADLCIVQTATQSNQGGMTDVYLDGGTYLKSFYSVIFSPSAVKIGLIGVNHKRIHHRISWDNCTPKIINQKYKKG